MRTRGRRATRRAARGRWRVPYLARNGWVGRDEFFFARQNARLVRDAEEYYREGDRAEVSSWNLRDIHMAETVVAFVEHLSQDHRPAKIVV